MKTNLTPTSADIQARIDSERTRLSSEQKIERDLAAQRLVPLEAGDDEALDAVEASINACRDRQLRIQERLEILETRKADALEEEADARLDAIAAKATEARERGNALIRQDYVRQARALSKTLAKLAAIDRFIRQANQELESGGRDPLENSNDFRCRPSEYRTVTVSREVGIGNPEHPGHGKATVAHSGGNRGWGEFVRFVDGSKLPTYMAVELEERQHIPSIFRKPLYEAIELPTPSVEGDPIWDSGSPADEDFIADLIGVIERPAAELVDDEATP